MLKLPRLFTYVPSEKGCLTEPSWEINNKKNFKFDLFTHLFKLPSMINHRCIRY